MTGPTRRHRGGRAVWTWVRRLAPWIITAVIVARLLASLDPAKIAEEATRGAFWPLVGGAVVVAVVSLLCMSLADWLIFRRTLLPMGGKPLSFRAVWAGRAGTSVLSGLHYGAQSGGYGLWLTRKTSCPATSVVGVLLFTFLLDISSVVMVGGIGIALSPPEFVGLSHSGYLAAIAILVLGPALGFLLARLLSRRFLTQMAILSAFRQCGTFTLMASLLLRTANLAVFVAVHAYAQRQFGLAIPTAEFCARLPILICVAALPINVFGLGAPQAAWVKAFSTWAAAEQIVAYQLEFQLLVTLAYVVRGLPWVASVLRDIRGSAEEAGS